MALIVKFIMAETQDHITWQGEFMRAVIGGISVWSSTLGHDDVIEIFPTQGVLTATVHPFAEPAKELHVEVQ